MLKLSNKTTQLLSSGQVITCACNVVKELLENAIDAFADAIEIKLEKGGLTKVEVRDNGVGIKASEVHVAAQRHYTSKITSHIDLQSVSTYGFRGEALNSMCEIADVVITTRTKEEPYSFVYTLNSHGNVISKKPSHIAHGTTITVSNLFKNLPVRKQFFGSAKKVKEQIKAIETLLMTFAIAQPNVQLKLINDRCLIWQKLKCTDEKAAFLQVLPISESCLLTLCNTCDTTKINIKIYFPKKYTNRNSLDRFFLIINKRPIRNKPIEKVVRSIILKLTGENDNISGWPTVCLVINLSPSQVDVNVNPNKTAVHLSCNEAVIERLQNIFEPLLHDRASNAASTPDSAVNIGSCLSKKHLASHQQCESNTVNHVESQFRTNGVTTNQELSTPLHYKEITDTGSNRARVVQSDDQASYENQSDDSMLDENMPNTKRSSISGDKNAAMSESANNAFGINEKENHYSNNVSVDHTRNQNYDNLDTCISTEKEHCDVGSKKWSCGNTVIDQDGDLIEPVKVIRPLLSCSNIRQKRPLDASELKQSTLDDHANIIPLNVKRPRSIFEVSKVSTDKNWEELTEKEQSNIMNIAFEEYDNFSKEATKAEQKKVRKSFITVSRPNPDAEDEESFDGPQEVQLSFDFAKVSQRIENLNLDQSKPKVFVKVVGYLNNYNAAVIKFASKYFVANLTRLQESLVFQKLSQNFKVPCTERDTFIALNKSNVGNEIFNCLQTLRFSQTSTLQPEAEILDERIVSNGFKIVRFRSSSNNLHISALATAIPCYGIPDLKEILLKICNNVNLSLSESRPTKCVYYLQSEASRIAQSTPALRCKHELLDALTFLKKNNSWTDILSNSACFHSKNIFSRLK